MGFKFFCKQFQSDLRIYVYASCDYFFVVKKRHGFFSPDIVTSNITGAITFKPVEAVERFVNVREGHQLAYDLSIMGVEQGGVSYY